MKKGKGLVGIIITIVIMILIFAGLVFAGIKIGFLKIDMNALKFGKQDVKEEESTQEENVDIYSKQYNVDEYATISKDEETGLRLVTFKKIESDLLDNFKSLQNDFKDTKVEEGNKKSNIARTNIDKAVFSVYSKDTVKKGEEIVSEDSYAVNINVESNLEVKNTDLIELYQKKVDDVSKDILNKFCEIVADASFVDETNTQIKATDIKAKSSEYTKIINENIDKVVIYTRKDKVYADVNVSKLIELFGLKTSDSKTFAEITSISI